MNGDTNQDRNGDAVPTDTATDTATDAVTDTVSPADGAWTLEHDGRAHSVRVERAGRTRTARVTTPDGTFTGAATGLDLRTRVECGDDHAVIVRYDLRSLRDGQAAHCHLVPADAGGDRPEGRHGQHGTPFTPPPGTRAAAREAFAADHPALYATRHVALATGQVLLGLVGVGFLVRLLVGWIPWPDWDLPSIDPPDLPLPDLPDVPWPDLALPGWVAAVLASTKYWVPILVAVGVAVREVDRRRKRAASAHTAADPADTAADASEGSGGSAAEQGEQPPAGQRDHHGGDRKLPD